MTALPSKPGIDGSKILFIPKDWAPNWFRDLINNLFKGADVRNATGVNGITVSGNISSPFATIGLPTAKLSAATPTVTAGQLGIGTTTAASATAGAAALPANPLGFLVMNLGGTVIKIPYYSA